MIAIIKYNGGNQKSVLNALNRLGVEARITNDLEVLDSADKLIFPGVGAADSAMAYLKEKSLNKYIQNYTKPFLGICLGMQLLATYSEENETECLGIINAKVLKFRDQKILPHMGWNSASYQAAAQLTPSSKTEQDFYFIHNYYLELNKNTTAICQYENQKFTAAVEKDNFYGTQFHPEKSSKQGAALLKKFIEL